MAQTFYKGDEIKFAIELTATGFSMNDNNFDIEVSSPAGSVKASKNAPSSDNSLVIFKETEGETDTWYGIVNTSNLGTGSLRVIATAHVPDANAPEGIRHQSDIQKLGELLKK